MRAEDICPAVCICQTAIEFLNEEEHMETKTLTVENLLGQKALQQYSDIFPVLALIFYDATTRWPKTKSFNMLFNYDEEDMDLPNGVMRKMFAPLHRRELANRKKAAEKLADKEAVMLSHTFVHNLRYTKTLAEIKKSVYS